MTIINVSSVTELYKAVNDINSTGKKIVLATGKYRLDPNQPNAGRLELQKDMELQGQKGNAGLVTIDTSALPNASFQPAPSPVQPNRTGAIRIGRGSNALEWITIIGNANPAALSAIDTDLASSSTDIRIANLIVKDSLIGIDIRNFGDQSAGRIIKAEIHDNELVTNLVTAGQGMTVQNSNGTTGSTIEVKMKNNKIHGNKIGCRIWNLAGLANTNVDANKIIVQSHDDQLVDNGIGIIVYAGASTQLNANATNNFVSLSAKNISVLNNGTNPTLIQVDPKQPLGGICAAGGFSSSAANLVNHNKLEINLHAAKISGNSPIDIILYGAHSYTTSLAGTNNEIEIHGLIQQSNVNAILSFPVEPALTNNVIFK